MIVHNFDPVLVDFGFFQIRWYSLSYILGIILGWVYATNIIKKTENNVYNFKSIKKSDFDNLIIYLVLGIIIGGRLGYIFFYNFPHYSQNIIDIFKVWHGGMSFHGGLIGVAISLFIFSQKEKINPHPLFKNLIISDNKNFRNLFSFHTSSKKFFRVK